MAITALILFALAAALMALAWWEPGLHDDDE